MSGAPFDGRFKGLAEGRPELLLRLFKLWEPGREALPIHLLRELLPDAVQIDHAYLLGAGTAAARILHFEAITSWHARRSGRLALYRFLIRQRHPSIPVHSFLVLMAEKYAPKDMPERLTFDDGDGLLVSSHYTPIRLWELDPAMAFEPGAEALLPWVPLLRGGLTEFEQARDPIEALALGRRATGDDCPPPVQLASNLAVLAQLRYDKNVIAQFLERIQHHMTLSADLFKDTWMYQEAFAEGTVRGKAEGKAEGRAEAKLSALRLVLENRFPGLDHPALARVQDPDLLDRLLVEIVRAADAEAARQSLASHLGAE